MMPLGRRQFLATATAVTAGGLMAACADPFSRPFPDQRRFTLDVRRELLLPPPARGPVLAVRSFQAGASAAEQGILTRVEPLSLRQDFYNQFFMPPASLVEDAVRQWLAAAGLFRSVGSAGSGAEATHVLEGELLAIYGDFTGDRPLAVLHLGLLLLDVRGAVPAIVRHGDHRQSVVAAAANPEALVVGFNQALRTILTDFERDIRDRLA